MKSSFTLKKNFEFARAYKKGKFHAGKYLVLYILPNRSDHKRIGITVSKKIGKSVARNRIRRLIRESYRLYEPYIRNGYDIVMVPRVNESLPDFHRMSREMKYLLKKLDVFDREKWECSKEQSFL